jgi:acetyl esterase/lipase
LRRFRYGPHPAQAADLHLPDGVPAREVTASAVLVHGGFWRAVYDRCQSEPLAADLVGRGWAVWNVDYRAVGTGPSDGGGWPRTFEDVAAAADLFAEVAAERGLPATPVVVGHSAGGALALWLAGRHRLPPGAPGASPTLRPAAVVAQAAVCDLIAAAADRLGAGAVQDLMNGNGPADRPDAYATANPAALLPLGVPTLVVTGDADDVVPQRFSITYAAAARAAGDSVRLHVEPGADHFVHTDPASATWRVTREWMEMIVMGVVQRE